MFYLTACLLLTTIVSFSSPFATKIGASSKKIPTEIDDASQEKKLSTIIPPIASFILLELANKQTGLNLPTKKILLEEIVSFGLSHLSKHREIKKAGYCTAAIASKLISDKRPSISDCTKIAGETFLRELLIDALPFSAHTKDNIPLQTGKFFITSLVRHGLDKKLVDAYSKKTSLSKLLNSTANLSKKIKSFNKIKMELKSAEANFNSSDCPELKTSQDKYNETFDQLTQTQREHTKVLINFASTYFINRVSIKFIAKTLTQITGKDNYISINQVPIVTTYDLSSIAVTGITYHAFSKKNPQKTACEMGKAFILNKMFNIEKGICKRIWGKICKKSDTIKSVEKWLTRHSIITSSVEEILDLALKPLNEKLFQKLINSL